MVLLLNSTTATNDTCRLVSGNDDIPLVGNLAWSIPARVKSGGAINWTGAVKKSNCETVVWCSLRC